MSKDIYIDVKTMHKDLETLNSAIEEFETDTNKFKNIISDGLDDMNSDFVGKIKKVLEDVADNTSVKSCEDVRNFYEGCSMLLNEFKEADTRIGKRFRSLH